MHIQQYHGYSIFRYLENLNQNNRGGWVDPGASELPSRWEEQLWVTLFAKAPEITLWPIGVKSYKPFHSSGEDYLPSYLGMAGIPMDIVPEFPTEAQTLVLTEQARFDAAIVDNIKKQLTDGKTVVITSGLLRALQGKGIEDIVELVYTGRTVSTREFMGGRGAGGAKSDSENLIPEMTYFTNDSGAVVSAFTSASKTSGAPILHRAKYSKGLLYVLTVPQAQGDLYSYPQSVLNTIREIVGKDLYVHLDAPSRVSLFVYDNDKFIVESFQDTPVPTARVITDKRITKLRDMLTGQVLEGTSQGSTTVFNTPLVPGSYRVFSAQ